MSQRLARTRACKQAGGAFFLGGGALPNLGVHPPKLTVTPLPCDKQKAEGITLGMGGVE